MQNLLWKVVANVLSIDFTTGAIYDMLAVKFTNRQQC